MFYTFTYIFILTTSTSDLGYFDPCKDLLIVNTEQE